MKRNRFYLILIALFVCACHPVEAPRDNLLSYQRITKSLAGGQTDTFKLDLEADRFIYASLFQQRLDVVVQVLDPQAELIQEIDNLKTGPEFIAFTSIHAGVYKIVVRPFNPMAQSGSYNIGLEKSRLTHHCRKELLDQLFAEFDNDYRTGAAAAIVDSGKIVYQNSFGLADRELKTALQTETRLNICSIGKQFTAFAIALLEQKGLLALDEDIRHYVPELSDFGSTITIQHLLTHSSGLREIADLLELSGKRSSGPFSRQDVLNLLYRQKELNFQPGTEYLYCNSGYILLAEIIERVTQQPYSEWLTEKIFKPLEMNHTFVFHDPEQLTNVASSYTLDNYGNYQKERLLPAWYVGAGNVFSTVEDMAKWLINFDYPRVGDARLMARLEENGMPMNTEHSEFYGFGRVAGNYKGLKYDWHGGGGYGYTAQIVHFPEYQFGAIVLSNFIYGSVHSRARQIADIFLSEHFTKPEPVYSDYKNPYQPVNIDEDILSNHVGAYVEESGIVTTISRTGNGLTVQTAGYNQAELYPLSDSVFFIKEAEVRIVFSKDQSGTTTGLKASVNGKEYQSRKVVTLPKKSVDWTAYAGNYYSEELNTYYVITADGEVLKARHHLNGEITLMPVNKNSFQGDRWYFSRVEFDSSGTGQIKEFSITNDRVRKVRFVSSSHPTSRDPSRTAGP